MWICDFGSHQIEYFIQVKTFASKRPFVSNFKDSSSQKKKKLPVRKFREELFGLFSELIAF